MNKTCEHSLVMNERQYCYILLCQVHQFEIQRKWLMNGMIDLFVYLQRAWWVYSGEWWRKNGIHDYAAWSSALLLCQTSQQSSFLLLFPLEPCYALYHFIRLFLSFFSQSQVSLFHLFCVFFSNCPPGTFTYISYILSISSVLLVFEFHVCESSMSVLE